MKFLTLILGSALYCASAIRFENQKAHLGGLSVSKQQHKLRGHQNVADDDSN